MAAIGAYLADLPAGVLHNLVRLMTGSAADILEDYFEADIMQGYLASSGIIGTKVGPRLFDKPDSKIFRREYVVKAEYYFDKFGPAKAVVLARFIPIVRTFLNPVAGTLEMPAKTFFVWNVIGGVLWTESMLLIGYFFGDAMAPVIDKYLIPAVALIVLSTK